MSLENVPRRNELDCPLKTIENARALVRRTLAYHAWRSLKEWRLRSLVLPKLEKTELHGVKLDLKSVSLEMKWALVTGVYEAAEAKLCSEWLCQDDTVLEVGSAIGFLGLYLGKRLGITNYVSVEANPETAKLLLENYAENGRTPHLIVAALNDCDGEVRFNVTKDFWTNSLKAPDSAQPVGSISVQGLTLHSLLSRMPFSPSAMIVDVEGGEEVFLVQKVPDPVRKLVIELHPAVIGITKTFAVLNALMNQGFEVKASQDASYVLVRN